MRVARGFAAHLGWVVVLIVVQSLCLVSHSEEPAEIVSQPPPASKWFVEVGPFWRTGGDVDVQVKSYPGISVARPSVRANSSVGPADRIADRKYDDGYVRMDFGTGDWVPNGGYPGDVNTWYWGYNNQEQVVGNQIVFHGSTFTAGGQELKPRDAFSFDLDDDFGGDARIGRNVFNWGNAVGSAILGFGYTSFCGETAFKDLGYVWSSQGGRITDTYNLLTDPGSVPPAPYAGSMGGPGYVIPNIPAKRGFSSGSNGPPLTEIYHNVQQELDVDLSVVSLGLDVRGREGKITYVVGAGLSGNFVCADSNFLWTATENGAVIDSARYSGDDSTFELGVYGEAGVVFDLSRNLLLSFRGRYDYVFDDAEVSFPNTNAEIDLSGFSALIDFGVCF
jgi:hypothetical protein